MSFVVVVVVVVVVLLFFFLMKTIYVIADDVVFMTDPRAREEYVLNDHGRIWVGSTTSNCGRPWNFGQVGASKILRKTLASV